MIRISVCTVKVPKQQARKVFVAYHSNSLLHQGLFYRFLPRPWQLQKSMPKCLRIFGVEVFHQLIRMVIKF